MPVPSDNEVIVTVDDPPRHGELAVGKVNEARFGAAFTVTNAVAIHPAAEV